MKKIIFERDLAASFNQSPQTHMAKPRISHTSDCTTLKSIGLNISEALLPPLKLYLNSTQEMEKALYENMELKTQTNKLLNAD